jgi:branched-chain amino acid transport system substrate-binding protein
MDPHPARSRYFLVRTLRAWAIASLAILPFALPAPARAQEARTPEAGSCTQAQDALHVGVVLPLSGVDWEQGAAQHVALASLPREISGVPVNYEEVDDGSDHTRTARLTRKLALDCFDVVVGPASAPRAAVSSAVSGETRMPVILQATPAAMPSAPPAAAQWSFQSQVGEGAQGEALVADLVRRKVTGFSILGINDFYNDFANRWNRLLLLPIPLASIRMEDFESVYRAGSDIVPAATRIAGFKPQSVLVAAPPAAAARIVVALRGLGYEGLVYVIGSAATTGFASSGDAVEGTLAVAGSSLDADAAALQDAGVLLQAAVPGALRVAKPGTQAFREALRDALEGLQGVRGRNGTYAMRAWNHSGLGSRDCYLYRVRGGRWERESG